jgi:hypothetical protein
MRNFDEPLPLRAAVKYANTEAKQDGWTLIAGWGQVAGLQMSGFVEWPPTWDPPGIGPRYVSPAGGRQEFEPDWLRYVGTLGLSEPQSADTTAEQNLRDSGVSLVPNGEDTVWFDWQKALKHRGKVPMRATDVVVDGKRLREQVASYNARVAGREEIAARHSAGLPYTAPSAEVTCVTLAEVRGPAPTSEPLLTLCELITWIAFGRAIRLVNMQQERAPSGFSVEQANAVLTRASTEVAKRVLAGDLKLSGTRGNDEHYAVQSDVFRVRMATANWWNTIEWTDKGGKRHVVCNDVNCQTADALLIWPLVEASPPTELHDVTLKIEAVRPLGHQLPGMIYIDEALDRIVEWTGWNRGTAKNQLIKAGQVRQFTAKLDGWDSLRGELTPADGRLTLAHWNDLDFDVEAPLERARLFIGRQLMGLHAVAILEGEFNDWLSTLPRKVLAAAALSTIAPAGSSADLAHVSFTGASGRDEGDPRLHELSTERIQLTLGTSNAPQEKRRARVSEIHEIITTVYNHAQAKNMKPPNVKEIGQRVLNLLQRRGLTATLSTIQSLAEEPQHRARRRLAGRRVYDTLLPFSDAEM